MDCTPLQSSTLYSYEDVDSYFIVQGTKPFTAIPMPFSEKPASIEGFQNAPQDDHTDCGWVFLVSLMLIVVLTI